MASRTKVPKPKGGKNLSPYLRKPRPPGMVGTGKKSTSYKKDALRQDPMQFTGFGFGSTGLTGES